MSDSDSSPPLPSTSRLAPSLSKMQKRPRPRFLGDGESDTEDLFALDDLMDRPLDATLGRDGKGKGKGKDGMGKGMKMMMPTEDADGGEGGGEGEAEEEGIDSIVVKKQRRVVAKLDAVRLGGPNGFIKLQQQLSGFKPKGKGHEASDLRRLMTTYQLWAHQMYPKTNLKDTLHSIETLCHKRSMLAIKREYRDVAKYGVGGRPPVGPESDDDDGDDRERPRLPTTTTTTTTNVHTEFQDLDDGFFDDINDDDLFAPPSVVPPAATAIPVDEDEEAEEVEEAVTESMNYDEEEAMLREMEEYE